MVIVTRPNEQSAPPPGLIGTVLSGSTPLRCSQLHTSKLATTHAPVRVAIATASAMWSKWPCVISSQSASTSDAFTVARRVVVQKRIN